MTDISKPTEKSPIYEDSSKYMRWGTTVTATNENHKITHITSNGKEEYAPNEIYVNTGRQGQEGKGYYTEYSQVSAIQTGFKKLKSNQIEILKELKKEYEVLRNSSMDSKIYPKQKIVSESSSNIEESQPRSSKQSRTHRSKHKGDDGRQYQLLVLEKKQLEIVVSNSMRKIEELLRNQIELKKSIHQLKLKIDSHGSSDNQMEFTIKKLRKGEEELHTTLDSLRKQNQKLKGIIKQLNENIGHLEGTVALKDLQIKKLLQERRLGEDVIRTQKNKCAMMQIDIRKAHMEYQILQKDKKAEIQRLIKGIDSKSGDYSRETLQIKKLEDQIQLKDKRYQIILTQFEQTKAQLAQIQRTIETTPTAVPSPQIIVSQPTPAQPNPAPTKETPQTREEIQRELELEMERKQHLEKLEKEKYELEQKMKLDRLQRQKLQLQQKQQFEYQQRQQEENRRMFEEALKRILEEKRGDNVNLVESVHHMVEKMYEVNSNLASKPGNQSLELRKQLQQVRAELQFIKRQKGRESEDMGYFNEMHYKIRDLQRTIEEENNQKAAFLEDMKKVRQDHIEVKKERDQLLRKLKELQGSEEFLKDELKRLKIQLDQLKNINIDLSENQLENNGLKIKIQQYSSKQKELLNSIDELSKFRELYRTKQDGYDQQIRALRRKVDQLEFRAQKAVEEGEFKINLCKSEHKSQISRLQQDLERLRQGNALQKAQFQNMKTSYEQQINLKVRETENVHGLNLAQEKEKLKIRQQLKRQYDELLKHERESHVGELNALMTRLDSLTQSNERYIAQSTKYSTLQKEIFDLRRIIRHSKSINDSVDHLWQVKETEYGNVNQILKQLKQ